jgi:hypothetical protein
MLRGMLGERLVAHVFQRLSTRTSKRYERVMLLLRALTLRLMRWSPALADHIGEDGLPLPGDGPPPPALGLDVHYMNALRSRRSYDLERGLALESVGSPERRQLEKSIT